MFEKPPLDELLHYGVKRRSGRYKWGSGEDGQQHENKFLDKYENLKARGLSETEIASKLDMNTTQLRNNITWARKEQREQTAHQIESFKDSGLSNVAIAKELGISEATVRNYKAPKEVATKLQLDNVVDAVKNGVGNTGYLDVGVGVERQLGVSRTKFNTAVDKLVSEEGYNVHEIYVKRLSDPSKYTTVKVLTKEADIEKVKTNSDSIRPLNSWSDDRGLSVHNIKPPLMLDLNRVKVRYDEEGGGAKDGLIELRKGAEGLDLGTSRYAQVRIGAGDNLYLKGMAAYTDDKNFPKGVDVIFNTNKPVGTPKEKVLKEMKEDMDNPFGATIRVQKGHLNIVNQEGEWDTWSTKLSSQFLSKQPTNLIKDRLDATSNALKKELDEIANLTNPVVKQHLLSTDGGYISSLDKKASHLKAQGLPRTKSHVLLPVPEMKANEIYAPNYKDGERVVLVRHPHGGTFEIPDLVVNNRNESARKILGNAPDAVGIHPSVAEKLSGADFDGDTALVIPNNSGMIKTKRSLQDLKGFFPGQYKVGSDSPANIHVKDEKTGKLVNTGKTIKPQTKQIQMGIVSNLITDMSIKGATDSELARAVKHSMVVIDSEKHNLDYKQSARDNGISALRKKYQTHVNPETGKLSNGASTLISRSKRKVDISDPNFDPDKYSSGRAVEQLYSNYIKNVQSLKNEATKISQSIPRPTYSKEAAKIYSKEIDSLNKQLNEALLNAPKERQAQLLTNHLYYSNLKPDMSKDDKKKLKSRSLARARETVGAKKTSIKITDKEWEAIQARAVSTTKLEAILRNADMDIVRKLATPRESKLSTAKLTRAKAMLDKGYTFAEVASALGVSTDTLKSEVN